MPAHAYRDPHGDLHTHNCADPNAHANTYSDSYFDAYGDLLAHAHRNRNADWLHALCRQRRAK